MPVRRQTDVASLSLDPVVTLPQGSHVISGPLGSRVPDGGSALLVRSGGAGCYPHAFCSFGSGYGYGYGDRTLPDKWPQC